MTFGIVEEALRFRAAAVVAASVDDALLPSALPAQVALPRVLDARGANPIAGIVAERVRALALFGRHVFVARRSELHERIGVDLRDVAEHVRAKVLAKF